MKFIKLAADDGDAVWINLEQLTGFAVYKSGSGYVYGPGLGRHISKEQMTTLVNYLQFNPRG